MKIRDASGRTMFIFGIMAFLLGVLGIVRPELQLSMLGFEVVDRATLNDVKTFYYWTVPFRGLTFIVFTTIVILGIAPLKFIGVPIWKLTGAIAMGIALARETK